MSHLLRFTNNVTTLCSQAVIFLLIFSEDFAITDDLAFYVVNLHIVRTPSAFTLLFRVLEWMGREDDEQNVDASGGDTIVTTCAATSGWKHRLERSTFTTT